MFFVGINPYITNYIRYHEILPGITGNMPKAIGAMATSQINLNSIQIFLSMIFSKMGDFWNEPSLPLKLPFMVTSGEMDFYYVYVPHFGNMGVLFSGIFIMSIGFLIYIYLHSKKINSNQIKISFWVIIIKLLQTSFIPLGIGGLRYVGYFYFIVPYCLFLLLLFNNIEQPKNIVRNIGCLIFIVCVFLNILPWFEVFRTSYLDGIKSANDLSRIGSENFNRDLEIGFDRDVEEGASGYIYNLKDYNIKPYNIIKTKDMKGSIFTTFSWQISFYLKDVE